MKKAFYLISCYTLLILLGGFMGYIKAGSYASLISSIASSCLLLIGLVALRSKNYWGFPYSITVIGMLSLFFLYRFIQTLSFFPAGAVALLSALVFTTTFYLMIQSGKRSLQKDLRSD